MVRNPLARALLLPFSLLYGLGVSLTDFFYRQGLLKGVRFNLPVIGVGNLTVGGAGKTPHIEYLLRLLIKHLDVAVLSRGYGRKTKGFRYVSTRDSAETVGDEPLQFKRKFPEAVVVVVEDRALGIPEMLKSHPEVELVLLDDAFQHRSVKPGLNILLTEYSHPFTRDFLLPAGRLREWPGAYRRADVLIVSKCPPDLSREQAETLLAELQPLPHQKVFFSRYRYGRPYYLLDRRYTTLLENDWEVLLVSAIARTEYLLDFLQTQVAEVKSLEFEDHHYFSRYDVAQIKRHFDHLESPKKIILTTEKDAMRLELHRSYLPKNRLPVFVLPIRVEFLFGQGPEFDELVRQFLLEFKV